MNWICKRFGQLTPGELHDALRLRTDVFVVEQSCAYPEVDGEDPRSTHLLAYDGTRLVAYARWHAESGEIVLGRIVVQQAARGNGVGRALMERAFLEIGTQSIRISAQCQLERYYRELGFSAVSEPYDDFGIPHVDMVRR